MEYPEEVSSDRLKTFDRILALEEKQDYKNRAVMGGIAAFLASWGNSSMSQPEREMLELLQGIFGQYGHWSLVQRRWVVQHVRGALQQSQMGADLQSIILVVKGKRKAPKPARKQRVARSSAATLDSPVDVVRGVGAVVAQRLERLGINTVRDLLFHLPRRHDAFPECSVAEVRPGDAVTLCVSVSDIHENRTRQRIPVVRTQLADSSGSIEATWFGNRYVARQLAEGASIRVSGKAIYERGHLFLRSPAWEPVEKTPVNTGNLVPVYPLTEGLKAGQLRRIMHRLIDEWSPRVHDPLSLEERSLFGLVDRRWALKMAHFPDSAEHLASARQRLCVDEFLALQLGMLARRQRREKLQVRPLVFDREQVESWMHSLPFALTGAQKRAIAQVMTDMARPVQMQRMLQGDVGSGKTVVALAAAVAAISAGTQVALMAPTGILAEQHLETINRLIGNSARIELLTGGLPEVEKARIRDAVALGDIDLVVGTHALIQESVSFANLGLAIVDEEHRFGVNQRSQLLSNGQGPHLLQMSATPIPRSLSMTVYGDIDVSLIDEMPAGRKPVKTMLCRSVDRDQVYQYVRDEIRRGHQAFVVCPLVEPNKELEAVSAVAERDRLAKDVFPELRLALLHGRMKPAEKEAVMTSFAQQECDILVATTVVEVGIDIPNATVMIIENAERFGLAQLHQLRGRVGRGGDEACCILFSDDPSSMGMKRLKAMEASNDGFVLAELDLKLRGPGDFFGVRQSGLPTLRVADLCDMRSLEIARELAVQVYNVDPGLHNDQHRLLLEEVRKFWARVPRE